MHWHIKRLIQAEHDLILGDYPLMFSNGFAHFEGHIALPIGPKAIFLELTTLKQLGRFCPRQTIASCAMLIGRPFEKLNGSSM